MFAAGAARAARGRGRRGVYQEDFSDFFSSLFGGGTPFGGAAGAGARGGRARSSRAGGHGARGGLQGTTRTLELRRPEVKPDGSVELRTHTVRVTIPAGVTEGQLIRLAGQGGPSAGGGAPGDLYLEVHVLPHRLFQLDGRNVTLTFPVAPWEAALGAAVTVPTLSGPVEMKVPAELADRTEAAPAGARPARQAHRGTSTCS